MAMNPVGLETKNNCAGEGQQQIFNASLITGGTVGTGGPSGATGRADEVLLPKAAFLRATECFVDKYEYWKGTYSWGRYVPCMFRGKIQMKRMVMRSITGNLKNAARLKARPRFSTFF
jgi:hypothetical protein